MIHFFINQHPSESRVRHFFHTMSSLWCFEIWSCQNGTFSVIYRTKTNIHDFNLASTRLTELSPKQEVTYLEDCRKMWEEKNNIALNIDFSYGMILFLKNMYTEFNILSCSFKYCRICYFLLERVVKVIDCL